MYDNDEMHLPVRTKLVRHSIDCAYLCRETNYTHNPYHDLQLLFYLNHQQIASVYFVARFLVLRWLSIESAHIPHHRLNSSKSFLFLSFFDWCDFALIQSVSAQRTFSLKRTETISILHFITKWLSNVYSWLRIKITKEEIARVFSLNHCFTFGVISGTWLNV